MPKVDPLWTLCGGCVGVHVARDIGHSKPRVSLDAFVHEVQAQLSTLSSGIVPKRPLSGKE
jgi:hypothetical protein